MGRDQTPDLSCFKVRRWSVVGQCMSMWLHSANTRLTFAPPVMQVQLYGVGPFPNSSRHGGAPVRQGRHVTWKAWNPASSIFLLNLRIESCWAADFQSLESGGRVLANKTMLLRGRWLIITFNYQIPEHRREEKCNQKWHLPQTTDSIVIVLHSLTYASNQHEVCFVSVNMPKNMIFK